MTKAMVLGEETERVYLTMLAEPAAGVADLAERTGLNPDRIRDVLDELADARLLETGEDSWRVVSPHTGFGPMIAEAEASLRRQEAELVAAKAALARLSTEHLARHERHSVIQLTSLPAINERLTQLAELATTECVSLNPGRRDPEDIAASKPLNLAALERGVAIRFVYADSVRNDPASRDYGQWLADRGGEARTIPVVPHLIVVVDRTVALLPSHPDEPRLGAVEVRSPGIVAALMSHFEEVWARAQLLGHEVQRDSEGLTAQERQLMMLLASGHTDASAARRLAVSLRTVRRMMSDLTERLGARSRFEAGLLTERRGWLRSTE